MKTETHDNPTTTGEWTVTDGLGSQAEIKTNPTTTGERHYCLPDELVNKMNPKYTTTGEHEFKPSNYGGCCHICGKPKADHQPATTGEWTARSVFTLYGHPNNIDGWQVVADAHNAALAAAIRSQMDKDDEMWSAKLAAERETTDPATGEAITKPTWAELGAMNQEIQQLREQLAAAVEALKQIAEDKTLWGTIARAALDKIGQQ